MSKIVDPDSLSLNVNGSPTTEEVFIDTDTKTVQLRVAGNLDDGNPGSLSGVTLQCLYSFLKEDKQARSAIESIMKKILAKFES